MKYALLLFIGALFVSSNPKTTFLTTIYTATCDPVEVTAMRSEWLNCGSITMTTYKNHEPVYNPTNMVSTGEKITDRYNVPPIVAFPVSLEKKLGLQLGDTILIKDGNRTYKKVFKDRMQNRFTDRMDLMINSDEEFYTRRVVYFIKR